MKNIVTILLVLIVISGLLPAQQSQPSIQLEQIWASAELFPKTVPGFNFLKDGRHYTRLEGNKIQQYDLATGALTGTILDPATMEINQGIDFTIDSYVFSEDETKILLAVEEESIYRHSTRAFTFVYDRETEELSRLFEAGKVQYASFDPGGDKVAFVYQNNLYYKDLPAAEVVQVTTDGKTNEIINGTTDWVYEEELSFVKAYEWSPDGRRLAFYRFDERAVPEFTMTDYKNEMYPEYVTFKYPKVGETNSTVTIHFYDLGTKKTIKAETGGETDQYIPRIKWTKDPHQLCIQRMNRHQNHLELLLSDARTGRSKVMFEEENKNYIDETVIDNLVFLKDGMHFIWTSEMDGWHHIYLYDMKGNLVRQLTKGEWEIDEFYGVDEARQEVYYQAAEVSPLQRQIYAIGLDGKGKRTIAGEPGWNSAQFSSTFDYFVLTHSTLNTPSTYTVFDNDGDEVRVIEDNAALCQRQKELGMQDLEFYQFTTGQDVTLNGWMIKPPNFDENRRYPVFMYLYGGPANQLVTDSWRGHNYWWFQMLAQQGYLVACVDNRGTGGRGEEFKKITYLQLGHYETIDQIEAARYLGNLPYADAGRIGIFGWSYGGYLSTLCLLKGNDVFKAAIAVAPVTNWKWYDTIYTERFMRTVEENPDGYRNNSPVNFADRLKGNYLLVHGMSDDNVHFQNSAEMLNALVDANKQFEIFFYPNRNHGIYGGYTRLHLYRKMTDFLEEKLKGR
jgi:dipeptidyl-peptidase-4